jgi:hypothetical protein
MKTKEFHLGDILSVMKDCFVSPRGLQGYYDLINFMVGSSLFNNQFSRAHKICSPYLLKQFPQLNTPEIDFAIGELREMLKTPSGRDEPKKLVMGWLAKLSAKYGETFEVSPLPEGVYQQKDPIKELQDDAPHLGIIPIIH